MVSNERDGDKDVTNLLKSGDKFGEDDIVAEENRQMMVVTQDISELFAIHKKVILFNNILVNFKNGF